MQASTCADEAWACLLEAHAEAAVHMTKGFDPEVVLRSTDSHVLEAKADSSGALAAAQVRSTESTGRNLILDLRELPSKQALALRSEVAMQASHNAP